MTWNVTDANGEVFVVNHNDISDWAEIAATDTPERGRRYTVTDRETGELVGEVRYLLDFPDSNILTITDLQTQPKYEGRGVATALLATLRAAYPAHRINPGAAGEVGRSFARHLCTVEPVCAETIILAHASISDLLDKP